jgi:hypothetical protein
MKEAAILSGVAEAVAWKNEALEPEDPPRKGQRVVIYPKDLAQLDTVLSTGDPNIGVESGHPIAYERILAHAQTFENPPIFTKADADRVTSDPKLAELVPDWLCTAERIATGSRRRVPEDGPDTWNSDDEAMENVKADEEVGMYTAEMDPSKGPKMLSSQEVARMRAAANALKCSQSSGFSTSTSDASSDFGNSIISSRVSSPQPTRQSTPANSDDDEALTEDQKRVVAHAKKCSTRNIPRCTSAPGTKPPPKKEKEEVGTPGTRSRAVPDPTPSTQEQKAATPPRAPAEVPQPTKEQQAPKQPVKGQESPGTKVPTPRMQTRSRASRAGGLRSGGGSGQTDTCVAQGNPSKT